MASIEAVPRIPAHVSEHGKVKSVPRNCRRLSERPHALREPPAMQRVMQPHLIGMGDAIEAHSILMDHSATLSSPRPHGSQGHLGIFSISTPLGQVNVPMGHEGRTPFSLPLGSRDVGTSPTSPWTSGPAVDE